MGRNNYKKASAPIMRTAAHSCDPVVLPDSPSPPHLLYIHGVDLGLLFWEELMRKKKWNTCNRIVLGRICWFLQDQERHANNQGLDD